MKNRINIKNPYARFAYELGEKYAAGIQLSGTEIKSIRQNQASIKEAFCRFQGGELYVINMFIAPYECGSHYNHEPRRVRKLLLHKRELRKLQTQILNAGQSLIPTAVFLSSRGLAKVEIRLAKGRKNYDKRQYLKEKRHKREIRSTLKYR